MGFEGNYAAVGDANVGKTSLVKRMESGIFDQDVKTTVNANKFTMTQQTESGITIKLNLWDTPGTEKFDAVTKQYFRLSSYFLFVYDPNNPETLKNLENWMKKVEDATLIQKNLCYVIATKIDLLENKDILIDGENFARDKGMQFKAVSSLTGQNVGELVSEIMYKLDKIREADELQNELGVQLTEGKKDGCC